MKYLYAFITLLAFSANSYSQDPMKSDLCLYTSSEIPNKCSRGDWIILESEKDKKALCDPEGSTFRDACIYVGKQCSPASECLAGSWINAGPKTSDILKYCDISRNTVEEFCFKAHSERPIKTRSKKDFEQYLD